MRSGSRVRQRTRRSTCFRCALVPEFGNELDAPPPRVRSGTRVRKEFAPHREYRASTWRRAVLPATAAALTVGAVVQRPRGAAPSFRCDVESEFGNKLAPRHHTCAPIRGRGETIRPPRIRPPRESSAGTANPLPELPIRCRNCHLAVGNAGRRRRDGSNLEYRRARAGGQCRGGTPGRPQHRQVRLRPRVRGATPTSGHTTGATRGNCAGSGVPGVTSSPSMGNSSHLRSHSGRDQRQLRGLQRPRCEFVPEYGDQLPPQVTQAALVRLGSPSSGEDSHPTPTGPPQAPGASARPTDTCAGSTANPPASTSPTSFDRGSAPDTADPLPTT